MIARAESLRHDQQVRRNAFLIAGPSRARAPKPAHHLIKNQQDAISVADFADALEISGRGRNASGGRAANSLRHKSDHGFRGDFEQRLFEFIGDAQAVLFFGLARALPAIGVTRRDVFGLGEQRAVKFTSSEMTADAQTAQRTAVITLAARDEASSLRLSDVNEILPGQLQRAVHLLRTAAAVKTRVNPAGASLIRSSASASAGSLL